MTSRVVDVEFTPGAHEYTPVELRGIRAALMDMNPADAPVRLLHPGDAFTLIRADGSRGDFWVDDYQFPEGDYLLQFGKPGTRRIVPAPGGAGDPAVLLDIPDAGEAVAAEAELLASDSARKASG